MVSVGRTVRRRSAVWRIFVFQSFVTEYCMRMVGRPFGENNSASRPESPEAVARVRSSGSSLARKPEASFSNRRQSEGSVCSSANSKRLRVIDLLTDWGQGSWMSEIPAISPETQAFLGKRGVSDCLGRSSWLWCTPWLAIREDGVEDDQELADGGGERGLLGLAGGEPIRRRAGAARECSRVPSPASRRGYAAATSGRCASEAWRSASS